MFFLKLNPSRLRKRQTVSCETMTPRSLSKRQYLCRGLDETFNWEREVQAALMTTEDHREGRAAFLEKRVPRFAGR